MVTVSRQIHKKKKVNLDVLFVMEETYCTYHRLYSCIRVYHSLPRLFTQISDPWFKSRSRKSSVSVTSLPNCSPCSLGWGKSTTWGRLERVDFSNQDDVLALCPWVVGRGFWPYIGLIRVHRHISVSPTLSSLFLYILLFFFTITSLAWSHLKTRRKISGRRKPHLGSSTVHTFHHVHLY